MDFIGLVISLILTLMVFSYIFGDNPLFKLAEHIFVGVSVGYIFLVIIHQVLWPAFFNGNNDILGLLNKMPPAILCFLLIFKVFPVQTKTSSALGSIALAFLLGVGASLAISGALTGTLYPQTSAVASINFNPGAEAYADAPNGQFYSDNDFLSNIVILLGTLGTLFYFTFTQKPLGPLNGLRAMTVNFFAGMGRWVILITLGALFANTVGARVALLVGRLQFLATGFQKLLGG